MKNCVYRFKNTSNEIIYIGRAKVLKSRLKGHKHLPTDCYSEVSLIEYTVFDTEDDVDLAERYFISKLKPKYNTEFKGKNITVTISDFEEKEWVSYGETFTQNPAANQIALLKLEEDVYLLSQQADEIKSQLAAYTTILTKLKEKLGAFTFSFNEDGRQILFLQDNQEKQLSLSKEVEQYHLIEDIIEEEKYALNEAQIKLHSTKVNLVRQVLGEDKLLHTEPFTINLFAKYEVFTEEEVIELGWNDLKAKHINECLRQLYENGYYYHTNLHMQVADDLEVVPYLLDEGWKHLLYGIRNEKQNIDPKLYTPFFNKMIQEIESEIEQQVGKLKTDFIISTETRTHSGDISFEVAHLVKKLC